MNKSKKRKKRQRRKERQKQALEGRFLYDRIEDYPYQFPPGSLDELAKKLIQIGFLDEDTPEWRHQTVDGANRSRLKHEAKLSSLSTIREVVG